jgi:hypothetical protein
VAFRFEIRRLVSCCRLGLLPFLWCRRNISLLKLVRIPGPMSSAFVEGTCRLVAASDQHSQTESAGQVAFWDAGCLVCSFPVLVLAPAM